jgi:hypothetical protein
VFTSSGSSIHSFDPGVHPFPTGTFWLTAPGVIDPKDITVNLGKGEAVLRFKHVSLLDWGDLANSLSDGTMFPPVKANMTATLTWSGVTRRVPDVVDSMKEYRGDYVENRAILEVSTIDEGGVTFSGQGDSTLSGIFGSFAEIGRERNGFFF